MLPGINQIIHIRTDKSEKNFPYKVRVADISNDYFSIEMPMDEQTRQIKLVPIGTSIVVWYISNDQGHISFETKVVGIKKEQIPLLMLETPKNYKRVQRRNYLRVSATVECSFKIKGSKDWNIVKTLNLSGGGLQFVLPFSTNIKDEEIEGWIALPFKSGAIEHIKFHGQILRVKPSNKNANVSSVSVKFTGITEQNRAKLIRFCYEKQVELRKK